LLRRGLGFRTWHRPPRHGRNAPLGDSHPSETPLLPTLTALLSFLGAAVLLFAPDEVAEALHLSGASLPFQLLGAAWLGLAMLNWMSRGVSIGGIYARPLVVTNLAHTFPAAMWA